MILGVRRTELFVLPVVLATSVFLMTAVTYGQGPNSQELSELAAIRALVEDQQATLAIEEIKLLEDQGRESAELHYLLGLAYQIRLDEVGVLSKRRVSKLLRQTLERAIQLDPAHLGAHEELADFYFFAPGIVGGSKQQAAAQIEGLEEVSPAHADRVRGRHAYNSDQFREAEAWFTRSLEHDGEQGEVFYLRGLARRQLLEKDRAALQDFDAAIALGYDEPMLRYQVGRLCVRLETCPERGEVALKGYIDMSKGRNRAYGHYRLAQLFEQSGRLPEALEQASASVALEPKLEDARALRERVEKKLADHSVAAEPR